MRRTMIIAYGVTCYSIGMASLVYMAGWLINLAVPQSIDRATGVSVGQGLFINTLLFLAFGVQHSVMARPRFKRWWNNIVPEPMERSTYVLVSAIAMFVIMLLWQPMGQTLWNVTNPMGRAVLYSLYGLGWVILVGSTFVLNHFDLFGLRHVWLRFRNKPYTHLEFATPGPYRHVRHPLYVGWITIVWSTPTMSLTHLMFALATTGYILIAIRLEESDLVTCHGEPYAEYRRTTPMLIPTLRQQTATKTSTLRQQGL
jgi:protein-S-isoprenylcysteine O-methyltransferase Ste14